MGRSFRRKAAEVILSPKSASLDASWHWTSLSFTPSGYQSSHICSLGSGTGIPGEGTPVAFRQVGPLGWLKGDSLHNIFGHTSVHLE